MGNAFGGDSAVKYVYTGDPVIEEGWTEASAGSTPGDRRMLGSVGPFSLAAGQDICIDAAHIDTTHWGGTNLLSLRRMKHWLGETQTWYGNQIFTCDSIETIPISSLQTNTLDNIQCTDMPNLLELEVFVTGGESPYTYQWEDGTGSFSSVLDNPYVQATGVNTNYYVSVTDAQGAVAVDTLGVIYNLISPVNVGNDTILCYGESLNINLSGYDSYQWNTGVELAS